MKQFGTVLILFFTLALTACRKTKKSADTTPQPTSSEVTVIEGDWETKCEANDDGSSRRRRIVANKNLITYTQLEYSDKNCKEKESTSEQFHATMKVEPLEDKVMTHKVSYLTESNQVAFQWIIRKEDKSFLSSRIEFLKDRNTSHYTGRYEKK